jgi:hypothetical protein
MIEHERQYARCFDHLPDLLDQAMRAEQNVVSTTPVPARAAAEASVDKGGHKHLDAPAHRPTARRY